jgi:hypothetical protein
MLPTGDPALLACGAAVLDGAALASIGRVAVQGQSIFLGCEGVGEPFTGRTNVNVLRHEVAEVLLAEASLQLMGLSPQKTFSTASVKLRRTRCEQRFPLRPRTRTLLDAVGMSQTGHQETFHGLFDYLVGAGDADGRPDLCIEVSRSASRRLRRLTVRAAGGSLSAAQLIDEQGQKPDGAIIHLSMDRQLRG